MSLVYLHITILIAFACILSVVHGRSYNTGLIFYDLKSQRAFLPPTVSVSRGRALNSVSYSDKGSIWSTFGKPCECQGQLCGCCTGLKVNQFNFDQKMCANVTYSPKKERIFLEVFLNQQPASRYGISARNPAPLCIPIMMPIPMAMCVKMSDIAIKGNNLNMCMDFVVRLATAELFEMHFQCMKMGLDGIQYVDKDGKPVIPAGNVKTNNNEYVYYDETSSDANIVDEHEKERDDNVIDNMIEIDDYKTKTYKEQMNNKNTDDTFREESADEIEQEEEEEEAETAENSANEQESLYEDNEHEIANKDEKINFSNEKEEEEIEEEIIEEEEENQTEVFEVPRPIATTENDSTFMPVEEDIMTPTTTTTIKSDNSETPLNEDIITTELTQINNLETTTQTFTSMQDIMSDVTTQIDIDRVNEPLFLMNNVPDNFSTTEQPDVKNLEVSIQTTDASHAIDEMPLLSPSKLSMVTSATAVDLNLVSNVSKEEITTHSAVASVSTVTLKPKTSKMLSAGQRLRKAKPKRKEKGNHITIFNRFFSFF